jgi:hypothetical protein
MITYYHSNKAVLRRPLEPGQDTAIRFTQRLEDAGARPSMGSVGDSFDNALAENFLLQPEGGAHLPHQLPNPRGGRA